MKNYVWIVVLLTGAACAKRAASTDSVTAQASGPGGASRSATADAWTSPRDARRTILFLGTSLTAGLGLDPDSAYPLQIQRMIDSAGMKYSVVNAGVSGETSSGLLGRLDWLMRQPFDVVVIETGANDGLRGISVDAMRVNIQRIIERIRQTRPPARIVLVQMEALPNMGKSYTQKFRDAFPALAKSNNVVLLPFLLDGVAGRSELNQPDGVHPNYEGEQIVARNIWKGLKPLLQ
jgi:acyl-CoA thioesterase-1